jgi:phenylalanyl-tRNA synthetase beta chain
VLHPKTQGDFGLRHSVAVAEIRLDALPSRRLPKFEPYETHTGVARDVNVVVAETFRHSEVRDALPREIPWLRETRLNSVYRGQGLPEGHKALHYTLVYRHPERSLTDEEVNAVQETVKDALLRHPGIRIK